jgi:cell division cycle 14
MKSFDVDEYLYLDKIENGDVSWIVPSKFIAFSGPLAQRREIEPGIFAMCADDYVKLFHLLGVTAVIRFNDPLYDKNVFIRNGIHHFDLFYEVLVACVCSYVHI